MRCSFCGKGPDQAQRLIAGPGVYICDACIGLCNEILAEGPPPPISPAEVISHAGVRRERAPWWQRLLRRRPAEPQMSLQL